MKYLPYVIGTGLFLFSAARFYAQGDIIGGVISGTAGLVAVLAAAARKR